MSCARARRVQPEVFLPAAAPLFLLIGPGRTAAALGSRMALRLRAERHRHLRLRAERRQRRCEPEQAASAVAAVAVPHRGPRRAHRGQRLGARCRSAAHQEQRREGLSATGASSGMLGQPLLGAPRPGWRRRSSCRRMLCSAPSSFASCRRILNRGHRNWRRQNRGRALQRFGYLQELWLGALPAPAVVAAEAPPGE